MKGPGLRTRLDIRREWICPETGKSLKVAGHVTSVLSPFAKQEVFMRLHEATRPSRAQLPLDEILKHMDLPPDPREAVPKPTEEPAAIPPSSENSAVAEGTDSAEQSTEE